MNRPDSSGSVAVVIVTWNGRPWVERCFGSLRNSSISPLVIVVDNGSTDGTPEAIADQFPEVKLVRSEINLGFGKGNNLGIRKALEREVDYVFLLNQDAWIKPDTLQIMIAAHRRNASYGLLSPMHLNGAGDALDLRFAKYHLKPEKCPELISDLYLKKELNEIYAAETVNAAAWLLSRDCLRRVGGFHPLFTQYGEDDNYLQRVHASGLGVGLVPGTAIFHDRDDRSGSDHFSDRLKVYRRKMLIDLTDPLKKGQTALYNRRIRGGLMRGLLKFDRRQVKYYRDLGKSFNDYRIALERIDKSAEEEYAFLGGGRE